MISLDNSIRKYEFLRLRKKDFKLRPMGKLEAKIDKFLSDSGVEYHRQWPIKLGAKAKKPHRYIVSFYIPSVNFALDMVKDDVDTSLYDVSRRKSSIWSYNDHPHLISAILPIDESMGWRDVKKQLQIFIGK